MTSVFAVIEPTIGALRALDEKKVTIKFAEIARAYYKDHGKNAPPALQRLIEAGIDVVASLIEKKDPPAWWEVTILLAAGVAQVIGGILVKTLVPGVGEFLGNVLINTGLDDVAFGVSSAISGEFSWDDYWDAKKSSLISAVKTAALVSVASFAGSTARLGAAKAWRVQKMSHLEKLNLTGRVVTKTGMSIAGHVGREVGRTLVSSGLSQLATRGASAVVEEIAGTYAPDIERSVREAVRRRWPKVAEQARALFAKLGGDTKALDVINACLEEILAAAGREQAFTSLTRTSKPAISAAASQVSDGGLAKWFSLGADMANLGVSALRMNSLVEAEVLALARSLRQATERKTGLAEAATPLSAEAFELDLAQKEAQFSRGLVGILNSLMESAVYAPLVAHSTQLATDRAVAKLVPTRDVEAYANSNQIISSLLAQEDDPNAAFFDDILRGCRGADIEVDVTCLSPEERQNVLGTEVEGARKTLGELQEDYKSCKLRVFRDDQGRLYVSRPNVDAYSHGVRGGQQPAGRPDFLALAEVIGRPIVLRRTDTGEVVTFLPQGRVEPGSRGSPSSTSAIFLESTPGQASGLDHISVRGQDTLPAASPDGAYDCAYTAVITALGSPEGMRVSSLRNQVAHRLQESDTCRRFYHNYSLDGEIKHFAGASVYTPGTNSQGSTEQEFSLRGPSPTWLPLLREGVDLGLDLIPGVSSVKDGASFLTGYNPVTGEQYLGWDRAELGFWMVAGVVPGGTIIKRGRKFARRLAETKKFPSFYRSLIRNPVRLAAMPRPPFESLQDPKLRRFMGDFWRPGSTIGNGSTAAGVRWELASGQTIENKLHIEKAKNGIKFLGKWLRDNPKAPKRDREMIEAVLRDTQNALKGI